jgi:hypothetical protein
MSFFNKLMQWAGGTAQPVALQTPAAPAAPQVARMAEAAGSNGSAEVGWTRLTGDGLAKYNDRDLAPMQQDRMQKLAEFLWQSNLLANRLVEIPLAFLLAEGVQLQCSDQEHQKLLNAFWNDPINNWPLKLEGRVRALMLLGEQCFIANVNDGNGFVRLGYLDPRHIDQVVMDPDNPEQPIGVVTKKDLKGKYHKYKVIVLGNDKALFSQRTAQIRADDFGDGECFLFQLNKFPNGSRGRSDMLGQMDWLDAYDSFLFGEIDRIDHLKRFVWDVTLNGADQNAIDNFERNFKAPAPNSTFVHNDSVTLEAKSPSLQSVETSESAKLLRMHTMGGGTMPGHWFGGGEDINRSTASEMGEPTFKVYTARQNYLKLMLQQIGQYVLMNAVSTNKDLTKFAAAFQTVTATVVSMIAEGLLTQERALKLVADVAARFGQEIDAVSELKAAQAEYAQRKNKQDAQDAFGLSADEQAVQNQLRQGQQAAAAAKNPANQ